GVLLVVTGSVLLRLPHNHAQASGVKKAGSQQEAKLLNNQTSTDNSKQSSSQATSNASTTIPATGNTKSSSPSKTQPLPKATVTQLKLVASPSSVVIPK